MNRAPINSVAALPTGKPQQGLQRSLGQVLYKGRETPAGLYPMTTRNDVEHQVGYDGPDTKLWGITGRLTEQQGTGITDSRSLSFPSSSSRVIAGHNELPRQSGMPSRVGMMDWPVDVSIEAANAGGIAPHRPKSVKPPYVRSTLNPYTWQNAVDLNVRGNMAYNEWQVPFARNFEQGAGFAIAGPAYPSTSGNVDTF